MMSANLNKKTVAASKISSSDGQKYRLQVMLERYERDIATLQSYGNTDVSNKLFDMILNYSRLMSIKKSRNEVAEVSHVQPMVTQHLWPVMKECLRHKKVVEWRNEYPFTVSLHECLEADGFTDHVISLSSSDFCVLTIEDKALGEKFPNKDIMQVRAQMTAEMSRMFHLKVFYQPNVFVGILQNGFDWVFLSCVRRGDAFAWSRVQTPTTNKAQCQDEEMYRKHCRITAQFIEDALYTADRIVDDLLEPAVPTIMAKAVNEDESNDDNQDDDDDQDNNDEENYEAGEGFSTQFASALSLNPTQNRNSQNNGTSNKQNVSKNTKRGLIAGHKDYFYDKENYATLNKANLSKVGVQRCMLLR